MQNRTPGGHLFKSHVCMPHFDLRRICFVILQNRELSVSINMRIGLMILWWPETFGKQCMVFRGQHLVTEEQDLVINQRRLNPVVLSVCQ